MSTDLPATPGSYVLTPEIATQLANGLEAVRTNMVALQTRTDMLARQLEQSRHDIHGATTNIANLVLDIAVLNEDVINVSENLETLNTILLTGPEPLRDRMGRMEDRFSALQIWKVNVEQQSAKNAADVKKRKEAAAGERKERRFQVLLNAIGWLISAGLGALAAWWLSK